MGFFQDLKEDLSMAVNELIPETDEELEAGTAEDGEAGKTVSEEAASEELETVETADEAVAEDQETVVVDEDIFRAAVERLDENADIFAENTVEPEEDKTVAAPEEKIEEQPEEAEPVKAETDAGREAVGADDLIKVVCAEVEQADEETELEKEVEEVMTQQSETVLTGEVVDETAIITKGMKVTGDVSSQGSMDVLGTIKGNIEILGKLNISGEVEGNSVASEVFADSANITGEIHASGSVKVGQSSVIIGNIFATSAVIAGAVKGDIDVQGPVVLDTSAIVMGNIKSKSVQINNGAVIEGMCSQCYADVNPASFFQDLNK